MNSRPNVPKSESMRAVVCTRYGSPEVLDLVDVERPTVGGSDVLVEVRATPVTHGDRRLREADFPGFTRWFGRLATGLFGPRNQIPGTNYAGRVVAVGEDVTQFSVGDDVFGACMHGAHAEYVCVDEESAITTMPAGATYEGVADLAYSGGTAWNFLVDKAELQSGEQIAIVGAAGGVGRSAVQLASHLEADVTAVCRADDADFVRDLGADRVVDYLSDDFTGGNSSYDVIFDTSGTTTFRGCRDSLEDHGRYLSLLISLRLIFEMLWTAVIGPKKAMGGVAIDSKDVVEKLAELVEVGALGPTVDSRFPLTEIRDAHRQLEESHPNGSVVVTTNDSFESSGDARE